MPRPESIGTSPTLTRDLYKACGVTLRPLPDLPEWRAPFPHGNKMVAATDRRDTSRAVFLDTDMVCLRPLLAMAGLSANTVAAAPEGVPTWGGGDDRWDRAYAHFGLPYPTERVRLLRGRKKEFVPYFNAGFVAFPDRPDAEGSRVSPIAGSRRRSISTTIAGSAASVRGSTRSACR
jgi:hypothetical protein